ncbi:MAG: EthD family reductase [Phycisphaerae bacterium]
MVKLIALYTKPADPAAFDAHYRDVHMPLAAKMPGLRRMTVAKVTGSPGGEPRYYQVAELFFDDMNALTTAMKSPEGKAAAKDVMSFAGNILHMMTADVTER